MRIKVDEEAISKLVDVVEKFDVKLAGKQRDWQTAEQDRKTLSTLSETNRALQTELDNLKRWRDSVDGRDLEAQGKEMDAREAELTKKKKEIEDLAYNKGYVAGYVEITQKLGKTT